VSPPQIPPAPDGGSSNDDLPGLVREVDVLRRRVDTVAETTAGLPDRVEQLADLIAKLGDALAAATARRRAEPAPSWLLAPGDPDELRVLLDELTAWLAAVFLRYPDGEQALPECWLWHPEVVEELLWLMHAWCAAYQGGNASVTAAGDWHDRQRPGVVGRLRKAVGSCSVERHQKRQGWPDPPCGPVRVPGIDAVGTVADWWAERRDGVPPEPSCAATVIGGGLG